MQTLQYKHLHKKPNEKTPLKAIFLHGKFVSYDPKISTMFMSLS